MTDITKGFLKNIDIYGAKFQFYINKTSSIKTTIGGVFTLLTVGFFIFTFVVFGYDFYYKFNPNVIYQDKIYSDEEIYKMNNMTVNEVPIILKTRKRISKELIFVVDANTPYTFQAKANKTFGFLKKCNDSYILDNFYPDSKQKGTEDINGDWSFLCYNSSEFKFGLHDSAGGQGSNLVNVLSIWTTGCNKTNYRNMGDFPCDKDVNFTTPWNGRSEIEVWAKQILFNPDVLKTPFNDTWTRVTRTRLSKMAKIELYLYLLETVSMDDTGFLLESLHKNSKFGIGKIEMLTMVNETPDRNFDFTIYLGFDKNYRQFMRRYMRFQDLVAVVGGILKAVTTFFTLITFPINEHDLISYLKNKIEKDNHFDVKNNLIADSSSILKSNYLNKIILTKEVNKDENNQIKKENDLSNRVNSENENSLSKSNN